MCGLIIYSRLAVVNSFFFFLCMALYRHIQQFLNDRKKKKTHQNVPQGTEAMPQLFRSQASKGARRNFVVVIDECIIASFVGVLSVSVFTNQEAVFSFVY